MDFIEIVSRLWPLGLGFVTLVILLAKMDNRLAVVEEKIKTLFDLFNKKS
jgi:hypothetical protein